MNYRMIALCYLHYDNIYIDTYCKKNESLMILLITNCESHGVWYPDNWDWDNWDQDYWYWDNCDWDNIDWGLILSSL